ncbi:hypothetical protein OC844_004679 [Tilletia horrida]|nr:hypothetical protein OC844_004679 [Tilletia horrida]
MSRPIPRRDSSTSNLNSSSTSSGGSAPGSSAFSPSSASPSARLAAPNAGGTLRSSGSSIYSLSPTSRRHLTPLTNPAPSTSTTSLSPSHARPSANGHSTATSRLRKVASNASIQLGGGSGSGGVSRLSSAGPSKTGAAATTSSAPQPPPSPLPPAPVPAASAAGDIAGASSLSTSSQQPTLSDRTISSPAEDAPPLSGAAETQSAASATDPEVPAIATMKRKTSPNASLAPEASTARRRTWFGFGTAAASPTLQADSSSDVPPPMDADEAAFRLALGSGAGAGARAEIPTTTSSEAPAEAVEATLTPERARALAQVERDSDSSSAASSNERPNASRTTNSRGWFTWRAQAQSPATDLLAAPLSQDSAPPGADAQARADRTVTSSTKASLQPPASSTSNRTLSQTAQPSYSSPLRRVWNRSEAVPEAAAEDEQDSSAQITPTPTPTVTPTPTPTATAAPQQSPDIDGGNASTWRFSLWSGRPSAPTAQEHVAHEAKAVLPSSANTSDIPSIILSKEANGRADLDSRASTSEPSTSGPAGYASYIASWVPGWGSSILPSASSSSTQAGPPTDVAMDTTGDDASFVPRTPAEQVKADALARPDPSQPQPQPQPQAQQPALAIVSDSIQKLAGPTDAILNSATRKSWVSFFSSRIVQPPRRIQDASAASAEDGPEVMDLDEDGPSSLKIPSVIHPSASPSIAESAPAALRGGPASGSNAGQTSSGDPSSGKSSLAAAAVKASAQKVVAGAKQASAVTSAASSVILKAGAKSGGRSPSNSAPTSPVVGPATTDAKGSSSIPAAIKQKLSNASLSGKANATQDSLAASSATEIVPARSKSSKKGSVIAPKAPNLVLPSFEDTFSTPPRVWPPKVGMLERTIQAFNTYLFSKPPDLQRLSSPPLPGPSSSGTGKARRRSSSAFTDETAQRLPRSWEVMGDKARASQRGVGNIRKIVVLGIHGWFAQFAILKNVMGEPTGTSFKFAKEMSDAVRRHFKDAGWELNPEAITVIALEGDGKVADRVHRLSVSLLSNPAWVKDLHEADAIFFSAHSQGTIVGTELLARLIEQKHIQPERTRVCLLAMAGIHEGPFPHLQSAIMSAYLNYFETAAARELFEFMTSTNSVAESYAAALRIVLNAGVKTVYVASVDDQVVPLHGALHTAVSHPSILRALYIDGQAFPRADFLTNLLVLCTQVRNAGLNDHDVLSLLSTTVAGSLYGGLGHSNVYEEPQVYDLAARYLFETTHPCSEPTCTGDHRVTMPAATRNTFEAQAHNPYSLPWAIRGLLEDPDVRELFSEHMADLLDQFAQWKPTSKSQKDVQLRLSPLKSLRIPGVRQRTASTASISMSTASSKPTSPQIPSNSSKL